MDACSIKIALRHNWECILSNLKLTGTHSNYPFNLSSDVFVVVCWYILLQTEMFILKMSFYEFRVKREGGHPGTQRTIAHHFSVPLPHDVIITLLCNFADATLSRCSVQPTLARVH